MPTDIGPDIEEELSRLEQATHHGQIVFRIKPLLPDNIRKKLILRMKVHRELKIFAPDLKQLLHTANMTCTQEFDKPKPDESIARSREQRNRFPSRPSKTRCGDEPRHRAHRNSSESAVSLGFVLEGPLPRQSLRSGRRCRPFRRRARAQSRTRGFKSRDGSAPMRASGRKRSAFKTPDPLSKHSGKHSRTGASCAYRCTDLSGQIRRSRSDHSRCSSTRSGERPFSISPLSPSSPPRRASRRNAALDRGTKDLSLGSALDEFLLPDLGRTRTRGPNDLSCRRRRPRGSDDLRTVRENLPGARRRSNLGLRSGDSKHF